MYRGSAVPIPTQSWRPCVPQPGYVEIRLRTVTDDKPLSRWWTKQWYAPGLCESISQDYNKLVEVRNEVWPTVLPLSQPVRNPAVKARGCQGRG